MMSISSTLTSTTAARKTNWRGGKAIACVCLLLSGLGTFALDRALQEPVPLSSPPDETGPGPVSPIVSTHDAWVNERMTTSEEARDFRLRDAVDNHEVHLASYRGRKPVVLVFGSFSCDLFVSEVAAVEGFYQNHRDLAEFLLVYIQEAGHPIPELDPILDAIPAGPDQQRQRVRQGRECVQLSIPTVLDRGDHAVENAYRAFPRRMVVIDAAGRIALDLGNCLSGPTWNLTQVHAWLQSNAAPKSRVGP